MIILVCFQRILITKFYSLFYTFLNPYPFFQTMAGMGAFVAQYDNNNRSGPEQGPGGPGFGSNLFFKGHQTLKEQLQSMKDKEMLEAMRKIVEMVAKGQDVSDLFPDVVKAVVSKSTEVKKLVYMYLVRYAEEQQDLALLSISTFQKGLKDPNQLIRASALRVLSSIRVQMIVPIMMLAIKDSVSDLSPYVRKTAAHAIPKLFSLDPEQGEQLIDVVEKLLQDKTTLVAGSAVMAFEQLCPSRIDLIHKNYRRLCAIVADIDEWGQCAVINMLTRYARTQFLDPNKKAAEKDSDEESSEDSEDSEDDFMNSMSTGTAIDVVDPDLRLLLQACRPLLQSRNSAVVMQVAQLFYHCAPENEIVHVVKALIRLLKSKRETQVIVLTNITTMSAKYRKLFEQHMKSFFVNASDPTNVRLLKLEILTNIATETNISVLLREFQTYVYSSDKEFAAATVHAIGRCAAEISEVTDVCMHGLMNLISTKDDTVVGESVIVIKKLLQMQASDKSSIIKRMTRLLTTVTVPLARASILWLVGEYVEKVPKLAPDVLRKMAKSFAEEEDIVKLQILNLAAKAWIVNNKKITLLVPYILAQAKYDMNYDIRDRERFIRKVLCPNAENPSPLEKYAKKFFMTSKPPPNLRSTFKNRDEYQLGSLSHMLNTNAIGYQSLPTFPEAAPDATLRNVIDTSWAAQQKESRSSSASGTNHKTKGFYSSEGDSDEDDSDEEDSDSDEESDSEEESDEESDVESEDESSEEEESEEEDSDDDDSSEEESSSDEEVVKKPPPKAKASKKAKPAETGTLLDFDFDAPSETPTDTAPSVPATSVTLDELLGDFGGMSVDQAASGANYTLDSVRTTHELLHRMSGGGLAVDYSFPRSAASSGAVPISLIFNNTTDQQITDVKVDDIDLKGGIEFTGFDTIPLISPGQSSQIGININFNDTLQPANFTLCCSKGRFPCKIQPPVGDMLSPFVVIESDFDEMKGKLKGMHEVTGECPNPGKDFGTISQLVSETAATSICFSAEADCLKFASKTVAQEKTLLMTLNVGDVIKITVNSEAVVLGSMILKDIIKAIES